MISRKNYTSMQFIDIRSGRRCDYAPDGSPSSYEDVANIIALFKVHRKYKERRYNFNLFGKRYMLKVISKA